MWGPPSTFFRRHGRIESASQPSYLPLAWGSARAGENISEYRSVQIIWDGRARRASRFRDADHQNRRNVRKSKRRLLEVRAAVGCDLQARLPAVDEDRTTETTRLDCIA